MVLRLGTLLFLPLACGHGAGAWKDPNHYVGDFSLAGLRFAAESPAHSLKVVGTDDGTTWWAVEGTCSGPGMTLISLDLSSKGGPAGITGTWAETSAGGQTISWPDGNVWTLLLSPTAGVLQDDGVDDHVGVFVDPHHFEGGSSWAGLRFVAEFPDHVLKMVGADVADSTAFWYLEGKCTGPEMTDIHFDFAPKGGPADLTGTWAPAPARSIAWPDGNVWAKQSGATSHALAEAAPAGDAGSFRLVPAVGVFVAVAAATSFYARHRIGRMAKEGAELAPI